MKKSLFTLSLCLIGMQVLSKSVSALPTDFTRTTWVTGMASPLAMRFTPDGRLFYNEEGGKVRIIKNGVILPTPFITLPTFAAHRESMVGIAIDPNFAQNGYIYVDYLFDEGGGKQQCRVSRITASKTNPDVAEPGSEIILLSKMTEGGYTGGALTFGKDGMLYIGTAHGGSQDSSKLYGKALRINPNTYPNVIPADNPFVNRPGFRPEIYALGFREPFTGTTDTVTGNVVFNDVGEGGPEEVDSLIKGANFGYEAGCEGNCAKPGMTNPWINLPKPGLVPSGCITGGTFYYGKSLPSTYRGSYFFADYDFSSIAVRSSTGTVSKFDQTTDKIIQLEVSPIDGAIYLLKIEGEQPPWKGSIQKIAYTGVLSINDLNRNAQFGPENTLLNASQQNLSFMLGNQNVKSASLIVYSSNGVIVDQINTQASDSHLNWNFNRASLKSGVYFYALKVLGNNGNAQEKKGQLFFLN